MSHCQHLCSTEIAALFDEMSEDEEPGVFESEDDGDALSDSGEADDDATLADEADTRRQLDLEFESVDGSERRCSPKPRAGRPIEHKEDPKKQKDNRRARERYKRRKLCAVRMIQPTSAQRQRKRIEQKGACEARDAFTGGNMDLSYQSFRFRLQPNRPPKGIQSAPPANQGAFS